MDLGLRKVSREKSEEAESPVFVTPRPRKRKFRSVASSKYIKGKITSWIWPVSLLSFCFFFIFYEHVYRTV